jgi:hypothetical protein
MDYDVFKKDLVRTVGPSKPCAKKGAILVIEKS